MHKAFAMQMKENMHRSAVLRARQGSAAGPIKREQAQAGHSWKKHVQTGRITESAGKDEELSGDHDRRCIGHNQHANYLTQELVGEYMVADVMATITCVFCLQGIKDYTDAGSAFSSEAMVVLNHDEVQ